MEKNKINGMNYSHFYLQFITHTNDKYGYLDSARLALEGGCRWIQLRMKNRPADEIKQVGLQVKQLCKRYEATFIIDDHVDLAWEIGADGVHLGKMDMPPAEARKMTGENFIIGGTANTYEDIRQLHEAGVNYIGLGPFRFTETKKNLSPVLGADGYKHIVWECRSNGINLPIVAIGGITAHDIRDVMQSGVNGIALSGAILNADDPVKETEKILQLLTMND